MAKPPYVEALEHFKQNTDDPLIAYVAFGLYIDAECKWAASQGEWPAPREVRNYFDCTLPHNGHNYTDKADTVLVDFATNIVEQERHKFVDDAVDQIGEAVKKHTPGFWYGVFQGVFAAFLYSIVLIVAVTIAARQGIDIFEIYQKAADEVQKRQE